MTFDPYTLTPYLKLLVEGKSIGPCTEGRSDTTPTLSVLHFRNTSGLQTQDIMHPWTLDIDRTRGKFDRNSSEIDEGAV